MSENQLNQTTINFDFNLSEDDERLLMRMGFPTFDEWRKNKDKWRVGEEELFALTDEGGQILKSQIKKHYYYISLYKVDTLTEVYKIAKDLNWDPRKMEIRPELDKAGAGKYDMHIRFALKDEGNEKAQGQEN